MDFLEVIKNRKSIRQYSDEPVDKKMLDAIIDIAKTAPSSRNSKSSEFMVIQDKDTIEAISQMRDSGSSFAKDCSAIILIVGNQTKSDMWADNCAISATFIQLAITAMDMGSCWVHVNGRRRSKTDESLGYAESYLRELLGVNPDYRIYCAIALGHIK